VAYFLGKGNLDLTYRFEHHAVSGSHAETSLQAWRLLLQAKVVQIAAQSQPRIQYGASVRRHPEYFVPRLHLCLLDASVAADFDVYHFVLVCGRQSVDYLSLEIAH